MSWRSWKKLKQYKYLLVHQLPRSTCCKMRHCTQVYLVYKSSPLSLGWLMSRCLFLSGAVILSYLNRAQLSHTDFLYLQDKEVPNIGAITELTNMTRKIKALSSECVAAGLNRHLHSYPVRRVTSNQRLSGPTAPSFSLRRWPLSTQPVSMSNIYMTYLGLCKLRASEPVEKWHSC